MVHPPPGGDDPEQIRSGNALYAGWDSDQLGLGPSNWGNLHKVGRGVFRRQAVELFAKDLGGKSGFLEALPRPERRLIACHCKLQEQCHVDMLIATFEDLKADRVAAAFGDPPEDQ